MLGGISIWQLLIIFVIVILIFGTKKLRNMGGDLGGAVKGFKNAMNEEPKKEAPAKNLEHEETADATFDAQKSEQKDQDKA